MRRTETLAVDFTSREELTTFEPASNDHWMRRVSIMTLLSGVGAIVCGYNISELDESLARQIAVPGFGVTGAGGVMWLITHLILKGSKIEEN